MLQVLFLSLAMAAVPAVGSTPLQADRSLVVNGKDAVRGRYPYFVSLDQYGAGVLIASDIVLTAGHTKPNRHAHVYPHVGTYTFENDDGVEVFAIEDMIRHPKFQRKGDDEFVMDFTVLKLSGHSKAPIISINRQATVPLPGQDLVVMGLGTLGDTTDERPDVLQEAVVQYLPTETCVLAEDPDREESYHKRIFPSHMCTVSENNEQDGCAYDSGGPIIIPGTNKKERDLLVALVSWGIGCADPIFPAVNARVSAVSDWIDEQVCRLSENPPADFPCHPHASRTFPHYVLPFVGALAAVVAMAILLMFRAKRRTDLDYLMLKRGNSAETASLRDSFSDTSSEGCPSPDYNSMEFLANRPKQTIIV